MKISVCLLIALLALAFASCSSETDTLIDHETSGKSVGESDDRDRQGPWIISEDDNRTNLSSCNPAVEGNVSSHELTVVWSEPENALRPPLYRVEIAEDVDFLQGYRSFFNLHSHSKRFTDLKPRQAYYLRLQAYLEDTIESEGNSTATGPLPSLAPSRPEVVLTETAPNRLDKPSNLEIIVDHGKFSATWGSPSNRSGIVEYVATLYADEEPRRALDERLVKTNHIQEWIVESGVDYLLSIRALPDPEFMNETDADSDLIEKAFHIPGNRLDGPQNFVIVKQADQLQLTWDPINNNLQNFEYLVMAYLDETKTEIFGEYHLNTPQTTISGVNQHPRYWFDLQAVPTGGNHADQESETMNSFLELPVITYPMPTINEMVLEDVDDPGNPSTMVKLAWEKSVGGDGQHKYRIEIAYDEDFTTGFQDQEEEADSINGEYGPLDPGQQYYLRMRAVAPLEDATRINSEWSEVKSFVTPGDPLPAAPEE